MHSTLDSTCLQKHISSTFLMRDSILPQSQWGQKKKKKIEITLEEKKKGKKKKEQIDTSFNRGVNCLILYVKIQMYCISLS